MHIKIHKSYRNVVSLCDSDLIGKKFESGKLQLDVRESFYKGEEIEKQEILQILKSQTIEDATFNIVGKKSIQTAEEAGIISEMNISQIAEIPFALTLL